MDENGSYRWPGEQPKKPTPKLNLSKITRFFTIIAVALIVLLIVWRLVLSRRRYRYGRSVGRGSNYRRNYRGRRR